MENAICNLELQVLTKIYSAKKVTKKALAGVSFTLGPGLYGLLGPNGAGKSTMMNIITGNLDATSGKVLWNGKNVLRMGREFRRVLGYMPQQQNLYDSFTGRRFLLYIAALKEIPRSDAALQVQRVAELVHLSSELEKRLAAYSGGMKQRLLQPHCWVSRRSSSWMSLPPDWTRKNVYACVRYWPNSPMTASLLLPHT